MANQCEETRVVISESGEFTAEDDSWIGGVVRLLLNPPSRPIYG